MPFLDLSWQTFRPEEGFYTSEVETPRPLPIRTFAPVGYEPRYAYPLIVFLHGEGGNEEQILRLAPRVSRRNYVSIGLRGPVCLGPNRKGALGFSWGDAGHFDLIEDYLLGAIQETRRHYHIHSERIFLAGFAQGAAACLPHGLALPGKARRHHCLERRHAARGSAAPASAGNAGLARLHRARYRQLGRPIEHGRADQRLLWSAGIDVTTKTYPTNHRLHADMLRDINRWIISQLTPESPGTAVPGS